MDLENFENCSLEELTSKANEVATDLKRMRDRLDDSRRELQHFKKKQKVIEIVNNQKKLQAMKEELEENRKQIESISTSIKDMEKDSKSLILNLSFLYVF